MSLPPGQRAIDHFPRFGVPISAARLPREAGADFAIGVQTPRGACAPISLAELAGLPRVEVVADFHCVTTWTWPRALWSGHSFRDVYERLLRPRAGEGHDCKFLELGGLDGYACCVALDDVLGPDVLLADRLGGEPLSTEHGAPLRLVVPQLYGYKNVKHVSRLTLRRDYRRTFVERRTGAHPRGRVALEERGRGLPGLVYRVIYRALLPLTLWYFRRAADAGARQGASPAPRSGAAGEAR